jgi:hypothetical protein
MFYEQKIDKTLRFGDIITNIVEYTPIIDDLHLNNTKSHLIAHKGNKYYVVMSPCCSIENNLLTVTPLVTIMPSLMKNDFLLQDFSRINRELQPQQSVPKDSWEKMGNEKKQSLIATGLAYSFLNLFVYKPNTKLEEYELSTKENKINTGYYMIDFKSIFYISSKDVQRGNDLSSIKLLQLSIDSRKELRDKLTNYFSRVPDEDKI